MKYLKFLGWDPAYKSLAHSYISLNVDIFCDILKADTARDILNLLSEFMIVHSWGVVDLLPGKKISDQSEVARTIALRKYLDGMIIDPETVVVIEHQAIKMSGLAAVNSHSSIVSHQIAYHYARTHTVEFIDPKLKNNIVIGDIKCQGKKYSDRKAHTRKLFDHIARVFRLHTDVKRANIDDLADSLMSVFAHCNKYNLIVIPDNYHLICELLEAVNAQLSRSCDNL